MEKPDIFVWLNEFDKIELPHDEWIEQMEEAVSDYNAKFDTELNPKEIVSTYINRL
jgi:hypothetical protein